MGGHNAGEVASSMALRLLQARIGELASEPVAAFDPAVLTTRVDGWISEINLAIRHSAGSNHEQAGMGTTLALALAMSDGRLVVANVGDSKVFLVRGVVVQQLSVDHTALAEQRRILNKDSGSALDDAANPFFHALTRSLGQEADVAPDIRADNVLRQGDLVVVTSDGVTDVLESERFLSIVEGSQNLSDVAETTYRLSFEAGSKDNITVALLAIGRPTRLGSAPPSQVEVDLDGTLPMARVRTVPQPISGGSAMADGGRPPAAPGPPPNRPSLRTPLLIAGAALFGCIAALVLWLTGRPAPPEEGPTVAASEPTPAAATTPESFGRPALPAGTVSSAPAATPTPGLPPEAYALPGETGAPSRETARPTAAGPIIRVPTARSGPGRAFPSLATPAPVATAISLPTASPVLHGTEKPAPPEPAPAAVAPQNQDADRAIPGREAKLVEVEVHYRKKPSERYLFVFRFDRPVREPRRDSDFEIRNNRIDVKGPFKVTSRKGSPAFGDESLKNWIYRLSYNRNPTGRRANCLEFNLPASSTAYSGDKALQEGDHLSLDLSGMEELLGEGRTWISKAPVFNSGE
jgi:protein phosphatase